MPESNKKRKRSNCTKLVMTMMIILIMDMYWKNTRCMSYESLATLRHIYTIYIL